METRIEEVFGREGFYVQPNAAFRDPDTGKSREIDIHAGAGRKLDRDGRNMFYSIILCECENNRNPVVFFTKRYPITSLHDVEVKASGNPLKFWQADHFMTLSDFIGFNKFHHYWTKPMATQYCSFQLKKDRSGWIALHPEEQHDTFNSLIRALEHYIDEHFRYVLSTKFDEDCSEIQIYYPTVVLQGDLYRADEINGRLYITKNNHIIFRKQHFLPNNKASDTYHIDVITENYLPDYLNMVDTQSDRFKKIFQRKRNDWQLSIKKIVQELRRKKTNGSSQSFQLQETEKNRDTNKINSNGSPEG
jgi:hypothetical protein